MRVVDSAEAINGVAFSGRAMAVSTRSEVVLCDVPVKAGAPFVEYEGGSHGVTSTPSGAFIAAIGSRGLLSMKPGENGAHARKVQATDRAFYFYKAVCLGGTARGDVIACALRRDGFARVVWDGRAGQISTFSAPGLDIVDVCPLGPGSAAALGTDGSIYLVQNLLRPGSLLTVRSSVLCGRGYRVLNAQGHLIVLTSTNLYVLPGLVSRFLDGGNSAGPTDVLGGPINAVDASVAYDRWLLTVEPDGGLAVAEVAEIGAMVSPSPQDSNGLQSVEFEWESFESAEMESVPAHVA